MPKLKRLSGKKIITILNSYGFTVVGQRGSHVKLRRMQNGIPHTLVIPSHEELSTGTTKAIFNQASRYISEVELRKDFYTN